MFLADWQIQYTSENSTCRTTIYLRASPGDSIRKKTLPAIDASIVGELERASLRRRCSAASKSASHAMKEGFFAVRASAVLDFGKRDVFLLVASKPEEEL